MLFFNEEKHQSASTILCLNACFQLIVTHLEHIIFITNMHSTKPYSLGRDTRTCIPSFSHQSFPINDDDDDDDNTLFSDSLIFVLHQ